VARMVGKRATSVIMTMTMIVMIGVMVTIIVKLIVETMM